MKHEHTIDKLGAWLDGELTPRQARAVRRHVEQCSECAARVGELKALRSALDKAPGHAARADFAERVRAAAERRRTEPAQPVRPRILVLERLQAPHPVLARLAAGLVVLAGLVVGVMAGRPEPIRPTPDVPRVSDPAVDALSAAPAGSVADAALAFYTEPNGGEQ